MIRSTVCKSVAILTAAAIGGLVAGIAVKPVSALSTAGVSLHAINLDNSTPSTQPSGKNGCAGPKGKNICGGPNGCQTK